MEGSTLAGSNVKSYLVEGNSPSDMSVPMNKVRVMGKEVSHAKKETSSTVTLTKASAPTSGGQGYAAKAMAL